MGPRRRWMTWLEVGLVTVVTLGVLTVGAVTVRAAVAAPTKVPARCRAHLVITATTATAIPNAACTGSYLLLSWSQPSLHGTVGQVLFDSVSGPPWTVRLPPCFWQVDMVVNVPPPHRPLIAGRFGGQACVTPPPPPPTSTTSTTATTVTVPPVTVPKVTTTTTVPVLPPTVPTTVVVATPAGTETVTPTGVVPVSPSPGCPTANCGNA